MSDLIWFPRRLNFMRQNIRNGTYPSVATWANLVATENHLTAYRHREIYRRTWRLGTVAGAAGTNTIARWRHRTGYGVTKLAHVVLMGLDTSGGTAADPYVEIDTTISGGATTTSQFSYGLSSAAGTDGPDELGALRKVVDVTAATTYEFALRTIDYARPLSVMVYELADTTVTESTNYYNTQSVQAGAPIYDADRERLLVGLSNMYRQNGGICWHWGLQDGAARTRTSATYINAIDNTETATPTAGASYGTYLNPQYHNTESRSVVPFELAAYGDSAGGAGVVRLISSGGSTYGPVTINGAAGWYTASINLPNSEAFYAIQYAGDGANTLSLRFVSLIEWE